MGTGGPIKSIKNSFNAEPTVDVPPFSLNKNIEQILGPLETFLRNDLKYTHRLARAQSLRLVARKSTLDVYQNTSSNEGTFSEPLLESLQVLREEVVEKLAEKGEKHRIMEATLRYEWLDRVLSDAQITIDKKLEETNFSEKVDKIFDPQMGRPSYFRCVANIHLSSHFLMGHSSNGLD